MWRAGATGRRRAAEAITLALATAVLGTVMGGTGPASAHADLAGTSPAADAVVTRPVDVVRLVFSTSVVPELTDVVLSAGDTTLPAGLPVVTGSTVDVSVEDLRIPGDYVVAYRTVASDGHVVTGSFSFEVAPSDRDAGTTRRTRDRTDRQPNASAATTAVGSVPGRSRDGAATPPTGPEAIQVVAVVGVVAIVGATLLRRRRPRDDQG